MIYGIIYINCLRSGALPGLMLDLGLLKEIWGSFFLSLLLRGTLTLRGPILFHFLTLRGKANLYLI